jgi:hypothetical protein
MTELVPDVDQQRIDKVNILVLPFSSFSIFSSHYFLVDIKRYGRDDKRRASSFETSIPGLIIDCR